MPNITELKQGSLNGLRRQTNECLENAYNKGYEDGAKNQDEVQYNKGFADGYNKGIADGNINDGTFAEKIKIAYENGYNDYRYLVEWFHNCNFYNDEETLFPEYKRRIADTCTLEDIITDVGFAETVKRAKAYEEKKKAEEEIKVGDEVIITGLKNSETLGVITMLANNNYTVICLINGSEMARVTKNNVKPTGRHFDEVEQLLSKLRGHK